MTHSPTRNFSQPSVKHGGTAPEADVGEGRLSLIARRLRYLARFIYWSVRHGSMEHAAWICHFEGHRW